MRIPYVVIILIFLSGCAKEVCSVGDIRIDESDIDLRAKASEIYYPGSGRRYVALSQLIKGYLSLQVLKSLGHKVDNAVLEAEAKRIDENTKAPEVLKKIKNIYANDRKDYIDKFVRVVYAERVLYNEVFLKSDDIHKEELAKAESFLKEAHSSQETFQEIAKSRGIGIAKLRISSENGIMPYGNWIKARGLSGKADTAQAERLIAAVSGLRPGDVSPQVIKWVEGYQIMKFIRKEGRSYIVQLAFIPKRNYEEWFWERASKVPVKIYDKALKNELLKEVQWTKNLKVE